MLEREKSLRKDVEIESKDNWLRAHSVTGFLGLPRPSRLKKVGVCVWKARIWLDETRKGGIDLQKILDEYHVADVMVKQGHVKPNA